jgi:hypothetical protein
MRIVSETAEISVTLKRRESQRYAGDGGWLVARGAPLEIKRQAAQFFGLEVPEGETPAQTLLRAEREWQNADSSKPRTLGTKSPVETVVDALGGEVIAVEETSDTEDIWSVSTEDDGTAGLGKGEQEDPLLKQIEAAESRHELLMIYTANKAEWERPEIAAAAKAKAAEWPK